ncbi:MAG: hypothetical protein LBS21_14710 [Clostridiales bacterium]|jgi:hypothetical protein|nr:hypothetical protein [Clostridiales bacterium]
MAAFELSDTRCDKGCADGVDCVSRKLRDECIIAPKIYDSCRNQECLSPKDLGPARAAEDMDCEGCGVIYEGEIIEPPENAVSVSVEKLRIKKIEILEKAPNPFKNGFWDVDIRFGFEYCLTFRDSSGCVNVKAKARSSYSKTVTLFGSSDAETVFSTDLMVGCPKEDRTMDSSPFIMVDAKAVSLSAELKYSRRRRIEGEEFCPPHPNEVLITIGLFSIIKLFRLVDLSVQSYGFCIPPECEELSPINPCEVFEKLDFPMDMFVPPQRKEFFEGISENIPHDKREC